jgi:hypothetical protein
MALLARSLLIEVQQLLFIDPSGEKYDQTKKQFKKHRFYRSIDFFHIHQSHFRYKSFISTVNISTRSPVPR